jgi:hypothetical protein
MKRNEFQPWRGLLAGIAVAALLAQPTGAALAQQQPAKKAPAKSTKGKNVMSRDELRVCLSEQDRLQQIGTKIKSEQAELDRQKAEVERLDAELQSKVGTVDPNDTATLAAVKEQGARRDALADAYNARLPALREQSATYDSGRKAWVDRCGNRDYDEMDEAAIRLEQKRAAAAASKKK